MAGIWIRSYVVAVCYFTHVSRKGGSARVGVICSLGVHALVGLEPSELGVTLIVRVGCSIILDTALDCSVQF